MNIARAFLIIGALYLVVGMSLGIHMGASQRFALAPVHAHINLVGFALMTLFGLVYRVIPAMGAGIFGRLHFWLFQLGAVVMLSGLYLLISETLPAPSVGPVMAIAEVAVLLGVVSFLVNLWKNA